MAPGHFPFLWSDPAKCGTSWEREKPLHQQPLQGRGAHPTAHVTACPAAVTNPCSAQMTSCLGTSGRVENNLQPDPRDGIGEKPWAKVSEFSQRKETRWINSWSRKSKSWIRVETKNEETQEKWHWENGTTFTQLQKEHFEISVVLGTFKCSSYKQNKHIWVHVHQQRLSLSLFLFQEAVTILPSSVID